ncbi:MAG: TIM barrel protein [Phycisphaeraceae bacterium]
MDTTRRRFITASAAACGFAALAPGAPRTTNAAAASPAPAKPGFRFCLNTATIRGQIQAQKLDLIAQAKIAAKAGYQAIEPWLSHVHDVTKAGGSLKDAGKAIADLGLTVESGIGFAQWIVDDDAKREAGYEQAKRDMEAMAQIGGIRIAAPPSGATNQSDLNLFKAAERYHKLCVIGESIGVIPMVEVWGFSKSLSRLGESMFVCIESGHPKACLLPDVYHVYKGGSDFAGLNLLSAGCVPVFHMNDYPADPPREKISDADRVYCGDGIAPLTDILRGLMRNHSSAVLSLELFNKTYYQHDALEVAKTGLEKMKASVAKATA